MGIMIWALLILQAIRCFQVNERTQFVRFRSHDNFRFHRFVITISSPWKHPEDKICGFLDRSKGWHAIGTQSNLHSSTIAFPFNMTIPPISMVLRSRTKADEALLKWLVLFYDNIEKHDTMLKEQGEGSHLCDTGIATNN